MIVYTLNNFITLKYDNIIVVHGNIIIPMLFLIEKNNYSFLSVWTLTLGYSSSNNYLIYYITVNSLS